MRDQLLADLDRWEPELVDWLGGRGTLWYGIFDKACKGVDSLISAMTCQALLCAPDPGAAVLLLVGQRKPVERLTLGQQLDVLRALNKRRLLTAGRQVPKIDLDRIESLVDKRNDFEHGRVNYDKQAIDVTLAFLADARALCRSRLAEMPTT